MEFIKLGRQLSIKSAKIIWPNFGGVQTAYNRAGERNFALIIPDEATAISMRNDGINVKERHNEQDPTDVLYYVAVKIRYKDNPTDPRNPKVYIVSPPKVTALTEETVGSVDDIIRSGNVADVNMDLNISVWNVNGKSGISLYLDRVELILNVDQFLNKYAELGYIVS